MADSRFQNQKELINEDQLGQTRFAVVGAGAIGSFFVSALSKMGARAITVTDFDSLENHNFANQMYPISQLGKQKVDALKSVASDYGDATINAVDAPWSPDTATECDVFVSAVDNMDVRRILWEYYRTRCKFFLDGRMSAQVYKVYGVETGNPDACAFYEKTLHTQAEASKERCGQKSIIYTVLQVSAQMCSQVKRYLMVEQRPTEVIYDCYSDELLAKIYHMKTDAEKLMDEFKMLETTSEPEVLMEQTTPDGVKLL